MYFTHHSKHSPAGFPDCWFVRGDRLLVRELKTERGRVTDAQAAWLAALQQAHIDAKVWRPSDWPTIQEELK